MKVAVGLSGGVDSSVAALLMQREGHEVLGITMRITDAMPAENSDAQRVAEHLQIPFRMIDLRKEYENTILCYIRDDYAAGRTPNPCVRCNREVKFGLFWQRAVELGFGFDAFATGHYALVEQDPETRRWGLRKGLHGDKDQAYFLSLLTQEQLERIRFPLGRMDKTQVRALAEEAGLFTHKSRESQDLCLGEYRKFLIPGRGPGDFVDFSGKVLGRHKGIEHYTIGQRRGLGIGGGDPLYVLEIREEDNTVVVGPDDALLAPGLILGDVNWGVVKEPTLPYRGTVKIRYRDEGTPATITEALPGGRYRIVFDKPRRAVTPGQLAVFYQGPYVALAGFIVE